MKTLLLLLLGLAGPAAAQVQPVTLLDVTGAAGAQRGYGAAAAWRLWNPLGQNRIQAGVGVRATGFAVPGQSYAPQTGPATSQLQLSAARAVALNAALHLRARVVGPLHVGFNIDLVGLTLGPAVCGQRTGPTAAEAVMAEPVRGNLLLGGTRDRGSLNSDFYLSADVTPRYSLHAGFSHVVNAYAVDGQRYQRFANLAALGVSYQLP